MKFRAKITNLISSTIHLLTLFNFGIYSLSGDETSSPYTSLVSIGGHHTTVKHFFDARATARDQRDSVAVVV